MTDQLTWIVSLFDEHGIEYWIESGTLLMMTRSGKLNEYDDDIDLAVWASDLDAIDTLLPTIEAQGYDVQIRTYHGHPYKYQFIPIVGESNESRIIDMMIFRKSNGRAWTAQAQVRQEFPLPGLSTALGLVAPVIQRYARSTAGRIEMTSFPKSLLTEVLTLSLPLEFVGTREYNPDLGLYTPPDVEAYLTFRYGDWRTPVKEWTLTDDPAVQLSSPEPLFDSLGAAEKPGDTPSDEHEQALARNV